MVFEIPQLNSCFCIPLKVGAIIIGFSQLMICLLYIVNTTITILRVHIINYQDIKYHNLLGELLIEYSEILQTLFSVVLIIGLFKDNSSFVMAWLLNMMSQLADTVWNILLMSYLYFHFMYFTEQLIILGFELTTSWIVFSYYKTMPKNSFTL